MMSLIEEDLARLVKAEILSDTQHHGIEILLPGAALAVRRRGNENGGTP